MSKQDKRLCGNCRWIDTQIKVGMTSDSLSERRICRRSTPIKLEGSSNYGWPYVNTNAEYPLDWCGKWESASS